MMLHPMQIFMNIESCHKTATVHFFRLLGCNHSCVFDVFSISLDSILNWNLHIKNVSNNLDKTCFIILKPINSALWWNMFISIIPEICKENIFIWIENWTLVNIARETFQYEPEIEPLLTFQEKHFQCEPGSQSCLIFEVKNLNPNQELKSGYQENCFNPNRN